MKIAPKAPSSISPQSPVAQPDEVTGLIEQRSGFDRGRAQPVSLTGAIPEPVVRNPGAEAVKIAQSVVGMNSHDLKLANKTVIGAAMQDWVPDHLNCANFVSAVLISSGQIPRSEGHAGVGMLINNLKKDPNFTQTDLAHAQPGDVVAFNVPPKGQHIMICSGIDSSGRPKFIGSDNVNKDGSQRIHESVGVPRGWTVMAVMHHSGPAPAIPPGKLTPTMDALPNDLGAPPPTPSAPVAPAAPVAGPSALDSITTSSPTFLRNGSRGPQVEELQKRLKDAGFDPGPIDGQFGDQTRAAVLAFQQAKGIAVDGVVGPQTKAALLGQPIPATPVRPSEPSTPTTPTTPIGPSGNTATAKALEAEALAKHGPEFVQKVKDIAGRLGVKPEWLLAVMKNESGMSTTAKNPNGGATGLIQFMPATARGLGTSTEALSKMSATQQLDYVEKFFSPYKGKFQSGADLYLCTFWPAALGKGNDYPIGGPEVARVNKTFDLNKDGQITVGEFREYYKKRFPELS